MKQLAVISGKGGTGKSPASRRPLPYWRKSRWLRIAMWTPRTCISSWNLKL